MSKQKRSSKSICNVTASYFTIVIALLAASRVGAQVSAPSTPDNMLTTTSPIGTPPGVATDGDNESVNLSNGALTTYIPLLSIPQRGGWSLPLAFIHNSNFYHLIISKTASGGDNSSDSNRFEDVIRQDVYFGHNAGTGVFMSNVPRLAASIDYAGNWTHSSSFNGQSTVDSIMGIFCSTNFVFTDWQGSSHPFSISYACNQTSQMQAPFVPSTVGDATDGSFYRIDLSNPSYFKVIAKDGTTYLFAPKGKYDGLDEPPQSPPSYYTFTTQTGWYNQTFYSMTDTNNNSLTYDGTTLTDTIGRTYTFTDSQLIYKDSNANSQTISLTMSDPISESNQPLAGAATCSPNPGLPAGSHCYTTDGVGSPYSYDSTATITYPASDYNGNQRTLTLTLDDLARITKISYPAGGYSRYDYQGATVQSWSTTYPLTYPMWEVADKYECRSSSGSCSSEDHTIYAHTIKINDATQSPYNSAMTVTDPMGDVTTHTFTEISGQQIAPKEVSVVKADSSGHSLWEQDTTYTTMPALTIPTDLIYPSVVTTKWYNAAGTSVSASSSVTNSYGETYPIFVAANVFNAGPETAPMNNLTEIDETDFTGAKRKTIQSWHLYGDFSASGGHILDKMISKTVTDQVNPKQNSTTYGYDHGSNTVGNLTSKTVTATNAPTAMTSYTVNSHGQVTQITDQLSHHTNLDYTDQWANSSCAPSGASSAYPTKISNDLTPFQSYRYNSCTGTIAMVGDANTTANATACTGNSTNPTCYQYDALQRVTQVNYPDNGGKKVCYSDGIPNQILTTTLQAVGSVFVACPVTAQDGSVEVQSTTLDGLGRTLQTQVVKDPSGADIVDTTYDADGRVASVSNPYRSTSDPSYGLTSYQYDALDRKTLQTDSDGSSTQSWAYDGPSTTFTDEAGNQWIRTVDAFGGLTKVQEPNGSSTSPSMVSNYTYDGFENLLNVSQWGGTSNSSSAVNRSFTYSGLSQLLCASNPESATAACPTTATTAHTAGTVGYVYDAVGNLTSRTDARNITTAYSYDALNRLTGKSYTGEVGMQTPPVALNYDEATTTIGTGSNIWKGPHTATNGIGRLTSEFVGYSAAGVGLVAKDFAYDAMGRVKGATQCWGTGTTGCGYAYGTRQQQWGYDLAGERITMGNSGSLTFHYTYDGAGRLATGYYGVTNITPTVTTQMVTGMTYFPSGQPQTMTTNNGTNTITGTWGIDNRLRVTSYVNLSTANSTNTDYGYSLQYTANSNVQHAVQTYWIPGYGAYPDTWDATYDTLNRLHSATLTAGATVAGCVENYDAFGNRTSQVANPGSLCTQPSVAMVPGTNRISSLTYDASGDVTYDGTNTLTYDAEGRIATSQQAGGAVTSYLYDVDGQRVGKTVGSVTTNYVRDLDGSLLVAYSGTAGYGNQPQELWVGGKHFGTISVSSTGTLTQSFSLTNWLGSEAVRTNTVTGIGTSGYESQPFGDAQTTLFGSDTDDIHFTGKERDAESGNDYFEARYFSSSMGRFMSPDWSAKEEPVPYAKLDNPQSLNLYSYVLNNPLSNVDTDGHACGGLYFNSGSGFCTRATEYGQIDAISGVQSQTRFFAAANAVSQALADVATPVSGLLVSGKTANFLEGVGQNLEKLNQTEAAAIQNGSLSGPNLDQTLVHNEQSSVQGQLNSLQQSDPSGYTKTIGEINGSLNSRATQGLEQLRGTDRAYAGVLAGVRKDLGRNIDFSKQGDREAIGNALIKHIRQTGGCDVNGKKQAGC